MTSDVTLINENRAHNESNDLEFENDLLYLNTNQEEISKTELFKFQKIIEQKYGIKLGI